MQFSYPQPQAVTGVDFSSLGIAMWVRNHNLGTPPMTGSIFGKNQFDPYISNVPVQSGPALVLSWRQHVTVTTLIVPRINNV